MSPSKSSSPEITFALKLAKALHRYGTPAHRLEGVLVALSERLGVQGSFFSTPTALFASFEGSGAESTHMQRLQDSDTDLGKLAELDAIFNHVWFERIDLEEAARRVEQVLSAPPRYGWWLSFLSFGLASGGAARFFGGGWGEMLLATAAGFGLGLTVFARARLTWLKRLFEPIGAFVVTMIVMAGVTLLPGTSADQAVLGGLIVLVPGFTLTVAVTELATRHLVSGTARISAAFVLLLMLGFGVITGQQLGILCFGAAPVVEPAALADWTSYAVLPVAVATIALLFQVPLRDFVWVFLVSLAGFLGVKLGSEWIGPAASDRLGDPQFGAKLGVFLGALLVGAGSNLYANLLDRPASVTRMPGMLFLVPGGFSFLSISAVMQGNALQGLETAFQVAVILTSLVVGFLLSNAIVPPRKIL